ncbi:MAG: DUF4932 domain-containing protein [Candidatus Hodarchaeota archaeon]
MNRSLVGKTVLITIILTIASILPISIEIVFFNQHKKLPLQSISTFPQHSYDNSIPIVTVSINPNIELLSVVLSFTTWFNTMGLPEDVNYTYRDDIRDWFGNDNDHSAIKKAQFLLNDYGFSYDAPPSFILHFGPPPNLVQKFNYSEYVLMTGGGKEELDSFVKELRNFTVETTFIDFFTQHQSFYEEISTPFSEGQNWSDIATTLETFFGIEKTSYSIILAPFMFPGGGIGAIIEDGTDTHLFSIILTGTIQDDLPQYGDPLYNRYLALHEFGHGFVNPIVEDHYDEFDQYLKLYWPVYSNMTKMKYTSWKTMLREILIRAFSAWVYAGEFGEDKASNILDNEEQRGFYFIRQIYDAYSEYIDNRDKFPTFEDFIPEIIKVLDRVSQGTDTKSVTVDRDIPGLQFFEVLLSLGIVIIAIRKKYSFIL